MMQGSTLLLPIDAAYTAHREAAKRQRETRAWLEQRERELGFVDDAPPLAEAKEFRN